jgi:hypothetical protein
MWDEIKLVCCEFYIQPKLTTMKKIILLLCLFTTQHCFSQQLPDYENVKMEQKSDYKEADKVALIAANYLLATPYEKTDRSRLESLAFIIKWMAGSPDFGFNLDQTATKISKGNDDMLGLYMAAMSKFALENRKDAADAKKMKVAAIKLLLTYCENESNHMKMSKELRKLSDANKKGELEGSL